MRRQVPSRVRSLSIERLEFRRVMAFDPTGMEQELMQLVNRFRTDPQNEFARIVTSTSPLVAVDSNISDALTFFNTNLTVLRNELGALAPVPPLAGGAEITRFAQEYVPFMIANKSQSHTLNGTLQDRVTRFGFDTSLGMTFGENLYQNVFSAVHAHASYAFDWGSGPDGLQSRGHRNNLMNAGMKQVGIVIAAVTPEPANFFGPYVNAQELIGLGVTKPMVTGAVFRDANGSRWYDAGEGLSGIQLTFTGTPGRFTTSAMTAGGYDIALPAGTYTAVASGGALRFPITIGNVVMGNQNVWLNFLYDPTAVPSDARESNDTQATATALSGGDQTLGEGTIHTGDVDYFRYPAAGNGTFRADLQFSNAQGNLDLKLIDANGTVLARSNSSGDLESVSFNVVAGNNYFLVVESASGGTGGYYTLQVTAPVAQNPIARNDTAITSSDSGPTPIDILTNDIDPDGVVGQARIEVLSTTDGTAVLTGSQITYTPSAGFSGTNRISYRLIDSQGLTSNIAVASVLVFNFQRAAPYLNPTKSTDVNGDGSISAIDVLLVINDINSRQSRQLVNTLAAARLTPFFVDPSGDGNIGPIDVLLVVIAINSGAAEGESAPSAGLNAPEVDTAGGVDMAIEQLADSDWAGMDRKRKKGTGKASG